MMARTALAASVFVVGLALGVPTPASAGTGVLYQDDAYGLPDSGDSSFTLMPGVPAFTPFTARSGGALQTLKVQLADASLDAVVRAAVTWETDGRFPGAEIAGATVDVSGGGNLVVDLSDVNRQLAAGDDYTLLLEAVSGSVDVLPSTGTLFKWDPQLGIYTLSGPAFRARVLVSGVDDDDPTVTITPGPESARGLNGWFIEAPWVGYECSDPTTRVVDCPSGERISQDGRFVREATVTDLVGHVSELASARIKVDLTDPVVTLTPDRAPNRFGWFSSPVTVNTSASDATSGVGAVSAPREYRRTQLATGGATDFAGNLRIEKLPVRVDLNVPEVWIRGLRNREKFASKPDLQCRADDGNGASASGVRSCDVFVTRLKPHTFLATAQAFDKAGLSAVKGYLFTVG
jgi:hypothetical protein